MKYVLDTNTVSAVMRWDAGVLKRLKESNRRDVLLPHPVVAETAHGIARLPRSRRRLEERLGAIVGTFERIEWTDGVSAAFGEIKALLGRKRRRVEDFDAAIAAHRRRPRRHPRQREREAHGRRAGPPPRRLAQPAMSCL